MEGVDSFRVHLKNSRHQAGLLAAAAFSLSESFQAEADRLTHEDEAQRLKAIYAAVADELEQSRLLEAAASCGQAEADLIMTLGGLAARAIVAATTKNPKAWNLVHHAFGRDTNKTRPFGTVMVRVGPKGLPDGVRVVSISELARESNRPEGDIIQELRKGGCLVFSQEAFSRLIDKLVIAVREGRLQLPVSPEKLSEVETIGHLKPEAGKAHWVPHPR